MDLNASQSDYTHLLTQFKEYAVLHPQLERVDMLLMRAIREPAGFAHVLVYGPSGVGKTTMIRQIAKRLKNENIPFLDNGARMLSRNGNAPSVPLLLIETIPPDNGVFNRTDYYRTALKLLDEPFYERRMLIDIEATETWEKKGRGRSSKTTQFNDSPELRHALEEAIIKRGVRAVILDEAQHLMKIGTGSSAGKLLDQLDWIKSMTNITGVLHILIGTYELLNFQNLSGQASRRGLDIHFPRYLYQHEQDRQDFQAALLALLKQVPLNLDIPDLMNNWLYFYERSIGCVGVLKDWLIRAVAAALHNGSNTLTLKLLHEHTLTLAQCERMALDTTEGEQKLSYMESRREHLWHLLQIGMGSTSVPKSADSKPSVEAPTSVTPTITQDKPPSRRGRKPKNKEPEVLLETPNNQKTRTTPDNTSKKKQTRSKSTTRAVPKVETPLSEDTTTTNTVKVETTEQKADKPEQQKKSSKRVGERKPKRDTVGQQSP
jgi:DNA polymerase III delta prime subunit